MSAEGIALLVLVVAWLLAMILRWYEWDLQDQERLKKQAEADRVEQELQRQRRGR